jgi:hypothetical protein
MKRTLVLIGGGHLTLYKKGLESFFKKDVFLEIFSLNDPRKELDIFDRLKFRFNTNGFRDDYYKAKKHEILNKIKNFEQVLFINLGYDSSFFLILKWLRLYKKKMLECYLSIV